MTKYWYERNPALLEAEKSSLETFKREYNHPLFTYACRFRRPPQMSPDDPSCDGKFEVRVELPFRAGEGSPLEIWTIQLLWDDYHLIEKWNGYGYTIKAYPLRRVQDTGDGVFKEIPINLTFPHLVRDMSSPSHRLYISSERRSSEERNAYRVLQDLTRWLVVYFIWETTDSDIDDIPATKGDY